MVMRDALRVWMNGESVGLWTTTRSGTASFTYDEAWLQSPAVRALSLSMPITANREVRGAVVENYFENLLPDSDQIRRRLRSRFRTKSTNAFDLLEAIGRDCVGAVQLLPPDMDPRGWNRIDSQALSNQDIERLLVAVVSDTPLGASLDSENEDFRISIAGAQEKTALLRIGAKWHKPRGATPTTHILKLPLGLIGGRQLDMNESVENEWLCAQIVGELGIPVARTEMATFGSQKVLVVERFDRRWQGPGNEEAHRRRGFTPQAGSWIARLPQEDFCQATGTPPDRKYEKDGGPSMRTCLDLLSAGDDADADRARFVLSQLAFWLLAAIDGHAKNFSIHHQRGGGYRMTPLYDILSAWPVMGEAPNRLSRYKATLAMAVRSKNAHYKLREITTSHWQTLARSTGVPGLWTRMVELVKRTDACLEKVGSRLPAGFPETTWTPIETGVREHAKKFLAGVTAQA